MTTDTFRDTSAARALTDRALGAMSAGEDAARRMLAFPRGTRCAATGAPITAPMPVGYGWHDRDRKTWIAFRIAAGMELRPDARPAKLARCHCKPSHIDPATCPQYDAPKPDTEARVFTSRADAQAAADALMPRRKHNRPRPQESGWHWARALACPTCGAAAGDSCTNATYGTHSERTAAARAAGPSADRWIVVAPTNLILTRSGAMYDYARSIFVRA